MQHLVQILFGLLLCCTSGDASVHALDRLSSNSSKLSNVDGLEQSVSASGNLFKLFRKKGAKDGKAKGGKDDGKSKVGSPKVGSSKGGGKSTKGGGKSTAQPKITEQPKKKTGGKSQKKGKSTEQPKSTDQPKNVGKSQKKGKSAKQPKKKTGKKSIKKKPGKKGQSTKSGPTTTSTITSTTPTVTPTGTPVTLPINCPLKSVSQLVALGTSLTSTGATILNGNVVDTGGATGSPVITGTEHTTNDAVAQQARLDFTNALTTLNAPSCDVQAPAELGGSTLPPGSLLFCSISICFNYW
jgi:hypothetical protein